MSNPHIRCSMRTTARYGYKMVERSFLLLYSLATYMAAALVAFINSGKIDLLHKARHQLYTAAMRPFAMAFRMGLIISSARYATLNYTRAVVDGFTSGSLAIMALLNLPRLCRMLLSPALGIKQYFVGILRIPACLIFAHLVAMCTLPFPKIGSAFFRVFVGHKNTALLTPRALTSTMPVRAASPVFYHAFAAGGI